MTMPACTARGLPARLCTGLILLCAATAVRPAGSDPVRMGFKLLEARGHISWSDKAQMQLGGLPVPYRRFSSEMSPTGTAEALAHLTGMFDQALAFRDLVVLSGTRDGWHWVAEIRTAGHGTLGLVSAIPMGIDAVSGKANAGVPFLPSWVPAGATLHFDQAMRQGEVRVRQRLYVLHQPPPQARPLLRARLADTGWTPAFRRQGTNPGGVETWTRRRSRLSLALLPEASGSALFAHLEE